MSDDAGILDITDTQQGADGGEPSYPEEPTYEVYDTDNDGVVDLEVWSFPDGSWQVLADTDGNLQADTLMIDADGDGVADVQVELTAQGNYLVRWDSDLDGKVDLEQEFTRADLDGMLPGAADLLDTQYTGNGEATPASAGDQEQPQGDEGQPSDEDLPPADQSSGDADYQAIDTDGDGTIDAEQWMFPDGTWQIVADTDGDAQADFLAVDTNGDGEADLYVSLNDDGTYSVEWDADFDGVFESQQTFTREELDEASPGSTELLDTRYGAADSGSDGTNVNVGTEGTGSGAAGSSGAGATEYGSFDDDGDGVTDFEQWIFPDGTWQVLLDTDFDLQPDQLAVDSNGDGEADLVVNLNDDGSYTVQYDQDGDGVFEVVQDFTRAELDEVLPGAGDAFDTTYDQAPDAPLGSADASQGSEGPGPSNGSNSMAGGSGTGENAGAEGNAGGSGASGEAGGAEESEAAGEAEYSATDTDGDGVVDLEQWIFPDGSWTVLADTDGDYEADTLGIDTDGDGEVDIIVTQTADGNYNLRWDQDGDGVFEFDETFSRGDLDNALPGVTETLDYQYEGVPATESMSGSAGEPGLGAAETIPAASQSPAETPAPEPADTVYEVADTDGDGLIDAESWTFADGTWQILTDSDLDGQADMLFIDTNGDDQADIQVCVNTDGSYQVQYDQDGDGVYEVDQDLSRAEVDELLPGVTDLLDTNYTGTGA